MSVVEWFVCVWELWSHHVTELKEMERFWWSLGVWRIFDLGLVLQMGRWVEYNQCCVGAWEHRSTELFFIIDL